MHVLTRTVHTAHCTCHGDGSGATGAKTATIHKGHVAQHPPRIAKTNESRTGPFRLEWIAREYPTPSGYCCRTTADFLLSRCWQPASHTSGDAVTVRLEGPWAVSQGALPRPEQCSMQTTRRALRQCGLGPHPHAIGACRAADPAGMRFRWCHVHRMSAFPMYPPSCVTCNANASGGDWRGGRCAAELNDVHKCRAYVCGCWGLVQHTATGSPATPPHHM